jgi:hypothetical protein
MVRSVMLALSAVGTLKIDSPSPGKGEAFAGVVDVAMPEK